MWPTKCLSWHTSGGTDKEARTPGTFIWVDVVHIHICDQVHFSNWASWHSEWHVMGYMWNEHLKRIQRREGMEVFNPNREMGLVVWTHPLWGMRQHDMPTCHGKCQAPHKASALREFSSLTHWSWNRKSFGVPPPWWMGPCSTFWLWKQIHPEEWKGGDCWE